MRIQTLLSLSSAAVLLALLPACAFGGRRRPVPIEPPRVEETESGLSVETLHAISDAAAKQALAGSRVSAHYTAYLSDGTPFDSSHDRGLPLEFVLGAGEVIAGWDQGMLGMRVGEVRRVVIPPELAYGADGVEGIVPPHETVTVEVELESVDG